MTSGINKNLDDLVNQFHQYGLVRYKDDDKKRNEIIYLYNMKEHYKNGTKDEGGKIPTEGDIMHCIYYLRWQRILPF
jgi:hypothetical protein